MLVDGGLSTSTTAPRNEVHLREIPFWLMGFSSRERPCAPAAFFGFFFAVDPWMSLTVLPKKATSTTSSSLFSANDDRHRLGRVLFFRPMGVSRRPGPGRRGTRWTRCWRRADASAQRGQRCSRHIDGVGVSFKKKRVRMGVGFSGCWAGANAYVFATGPNVNKG